MMDRSGIIWSNKVCCALMLALLVHVPALAEGLLTFKIVAKDGKITPASINAPAGQRIKLEIRNEGKSPIEFENLQLRVEKVLAADSESFVVLNPLKPGVYPFVDEFHLQTGKMDLIVK